MFLFTKFIFGFGRPTQSKYNLKREEEFCSLSIIFGFDRPTQSKYNLKREEEFCSVDIICLWRRVDLKYCNLGKIH
jgi:hypothetical protein